MTQFIEVDIFGSKNLEYINISNIYTISQNGEHSIICIVPNYIKLEIKESIDILIIRLEYGLENGFAIIRVE